MRVAPAPLYNTAREVRAFVLLLVEAVAEVRREVTEEDKAAAERAAAAKEDKAAVAPGAGSSAATVSTAAAEASGVPRSRGKRGAEGSAEEDGGQA
jgi:hypothetical protein